MLQSLFKAYRSGTWSHLDRDKFLKGNLFAPAYRYTGNRTAQVTLYDGHTIFVDTDDIGNGLSVAKHRMYEPHIELLLRQLIQPGQTVVDIGANNGCHTITMAACVGPQGRVIAVEPQPRAYNLLRKAMFANDYMNIITPLNCALGEATGTINILYDPLWTGGGHVRDDDQIAHYDEKWRSERVTVRRLDDCLAELSVDRIDVVKIDVEGYEAAALRGFGKMLENPNIRVIMEWSQPNLKAHGDPNDLYTELTGMGFKFSRIEGRGTLIPCGRAEMLALEHGDALLEREL